MIEEFDKDKPGNIIKPSEIPMLGIEWMRMGFLLILLRNSLDINQMVPKDIDLMKQLVEEVLPQRKWFALRFDMV